MTRRIDVVWTRRGVILNVVKVYQPEHGWKDRTLVSVSLTPEQAKRLARNLRGKP